MKEIPANQENVKLLWTGGWDSTFQLLQLMIIHRRQVTPFYVINEERLSSGLEILAMMRIKDRILEEYPHTQELIQPTQYFSGEDIPQDLKITEAFQSVFKEKFMGTQYEWLARFCKANGITDIQLCIHLDDKAHFVVEQVVSESTDGFQTIFRVDQKFYEMNEFILFRYFSFPIFKLSKIQMSAIANEKGWGEIMDMTWFCHEPTSKMNPCGICNPCLYTIEEGLSRRIPIRSRVRSFFHRRLPRPLKSLAKIILSKLRLLKYIQKSAL
jgi:7-cyano-7-deazaguanine synthase in queuosine biosynthesis